MTSRRLGDILDFCEMEQIVKLKFLDSGKEEYFGSYAAIYDKHNKEEIGVPLYVLWNNENGYRNDKVEITKFPVYRKKQKK